MDRQQNRVKEKGLGLGAYGRSAKWNMVVPFVGGRRRVGEEDVAELTASTSWYHLMKRRQRARVTDGAVFSLRHFHKQVEDVPTCLSMEQGTSKQGLPWAATRREESRG
jgi:hypothetical protein